MKKILFLVLFSIVSVFSYAQEGCGISATTQLIHGVDGVYSVPNEPGYSYFWSVSGNLTILPNNENNTDSSVVIGTTASSTGTIYGNVYVTKYKAGVAPCCNEVLINVTGGGNGDGDQEPVCGVEISTITQLNVLGIENVMFFAPMTLQFGWNYVESTFVVTYEYGQVITYQGALNVNNYPQITIPVDDCVDGGGVTKVCVTVRANNPSGRISSIKVPNPIGSTCTDTVCKNYNVIVCGTSQLKDSNSFGKIKNPIKNILKVNLNDEKQAEVLIYDYSGNLKKKTKVVKGENIDVSDLKNGLYIVKLISKDGLVETKKIQIQR